MKSIVTLTYDLSSRTCQTPQPPSHFHGSSHDSATTSKYIYPSRDAKCSMNHEPTTPVRIATGWCGLIRLQYRQLRIAQDCYGYCPDFATDCYDTCTDRYGFLRHVYGLPRIVMTPVRIATIRTRIATTSVRIGGTDLNVLCIFELYLFDWRHEKRALISLTS